MSVVLWMVLARLNIWNLGVFAELEIAAEVDGAPPIDAVTRRKMDNFKATQEAKLNGFVICLRWLLFGYTIALLLIAVARSYVHALLAASLLGVFYPNLLIVLVLYYKFIMILNHLIHSYISLFTI